MKFRGSPMPFVFFILCTAYAKNLSAQLSAADSLLYGKSINKIITLFHESLGEQSGLYNGSQYVPYSFTIRDGKHPFFGMNDFGAGTIVYDNDLYPSAQLKYNEVEDFLVFKNNGQGIKLISERVSRFSILGNTFVRLTEENQNPSIPATGFYQILYEGKITVLKKEVKTINEEVVNNSETMGHFISVKTYYFIKKNETYYPVTGKSGMIGITKEHKKEIQSFIKSNGLSYKKDKDNFLIKVAAFYDQLTK